MIIWIARKHSAFVFSQGWNPHFLIVKTFAKKEDAIDFVKDKNKRALYSRYTVGKVELKESA